MPRRRWTFLLLVIATAGCTRQSPAPEPAVALAPAAVSKPSLAAPKGPATLAEARQILDLRTMPTMPNARPHIVRTNRLIYSAPGTLAAAQALYRDRLLQEGWKLADTPMPGIDPNNFTYAAFDRLGFRVAVTAAKNRTTDGWVDVFLVNHGNIAAHSLPTTTDAKPVVSKPWDYASYTTDAKPAEVIAFYRKRLPATGWREYRVAGAAFLATEDRHLLGFSQNGVETIVNIKGAKSAPTIVDCIVSLRDRPAVTPPDKIPKAATFAEAKKIIDLNRFVRLGSFEANGTSAEHTYALPESPQFTVPSVESFYRKNLKLQGWTEDDASSDLDDEGRLVFAKDGYLLACNIHKQNDETLVRLENMGNVRAADIPRLPDASERTWEPANDVSYETETPVDKSTEFYRKQFALLGWKEVALNDAPDGGKLLVCRQNAIVMKVELQPDRIRIRSEVLGEIVPRPASEAVTLQIVDLRKWPRLKDAPATKIDSAHLEYVAAAPVPDATALHRNQLQSAAWRELPQRGKDPELRFEKEGFVVELLVEPAKGDDKSAVVTLRSRGDVDLRLLPIFDAARADPQSVQEDVRQTAATPVNAEDIALVLQRFGWTQMKSDGAASPTRLEFRQRLVRLTVEMTPLPDGKSSLRFRTWGIAADKK